MSQFDFPRIQFSGYAYINPATANNNFLLPLVIFDPIQVKPVLPPRIYLTPDLMYLHRLGGLPLPESDEIQTDEQKQPYIEIKPVDSREKFMAWAISPLGRCDVDAAYHDIYAMVRIKRTNQRLTGHLPANWNFFGGMEFGFRDVSVTGVSTLKHGQEPRLFTPETPGCPADIARLLGATLGMENGQGKSAAVMVDVLPSLAYYSQVFCDSLRLEKNGETLLQGKPGKASLRFLNQHRIVNQEGALAASGSFFTVIPTQDLENGEQAPIMQFFLKQHPTERPVKGIFVRYNLFEIEENLQPDYAALGMEGNPALATVVGTLSPWYEEDMTSMAVGRLLVPKTPFMQALSLAPVVCRVDTERDMISLDFLGSIPAQRTQETPVPRYETYPLGLVRLVLLTEGKLPVELGSFRIDDTCFGHSQLFETGGLIDLPLKNRLGLSRKAIMAGTLGLCGASKTTEDPDALLLIESEYMVTTDQAGLYADQGDDPAGGYTSNSSNKEPCQIRVFHKGQPVQKPIPMTIMELKITGKGTTATGKEYLKTNAFYDKQQLYLPTDQAANALYIFYPGNHNLPSQDLIADLVRTGFFVNLRVLPAHAYGKYLDPGHPDYPCPVTFEVLYREVLQTYDLLFPLASVITPFEEDYLRKGWKYVQYRLSPDQWGTATYMPSSRDMSGDQWALFCKWAEGLSER